MIQPNREEYRKLGKKYDLIPVYDRVKTDFDTPISIFRKVSAKLLLESVEKGENVGRYSIIGIGRLARVEIRGGDTHFREYGPEGKVTGQWTESNLKGLDGIRRYFQGLQCHMPGDLPPFFAGGIGYLGYECAARFEKVPIQRAVEGDLPDGVMIIPAYTLVYDSVRRITTVIRLCRARGRGRVDYSTAQAGLRKIREQMEGPFRLEKGGGKCTIQGPVGEFPGKKEYLGQVERCREKIREGEIIQGVLSREIRFPLSGDPFELYRRLRIINPSPYLYYLDLDGTVITGSSPEVMVRVEDRELLLKPIAGTRKRGRSLDEDEENMRRLKNDPKERAEHIMLVDLGRNDLGRVAVPGSVSVMSYMEIEKYSHVMHLVSTIKARLDGEKDIFDVIAATFPAGTLSGAPKIRAMEIIHELENRRRGPYGGMIFNLGFNGRLDSCITIRSLVIQNRQAGLTVGAGIVADSRPESEFNETRQKAAAILAAASADYREEDHDSAD